MFASSQGIDLIAGGRNKKTSRTAPKSDNVYVKLLVKVRVMRCVFAVFAVVVVVVVATATAAIRVMSGARAVVEALERASASD